MIKRSKKQIWILLFLHFRFNIASCSFPLFNRGATVSDWLMMCTASDLWNCILCMLLLPYFYSVYGIAKKKLIWWICSVLLDAARQYTAAAISKLIKNATYTISVDERMTIQGNFKYYMMEIQYAMNKIVVIIFDQHASAPAILNMVLNFLDWVLL